MLTIKILGPGCANCVRVEELARKAVKELGIEAEVIKVSNVEDIVEYNVLSTPGVVINEKVVASGRIPALSTMIGWIKQATNGA